MSYEEKTRRKVVAVVTQEDGEFWAEYDGPEGNAFVEGENLEELEANMRQALAAFFSVATGEEHSEDDFEIKFEFSMEEFFLQYSAINLTKLAEVAGFSPALVRHYKNGVKRPSLKRANQLISAVKQYGQKLSEAKTFH